MWEPEVWYPSNAAKQQYKSYTEACYKIRSLIKAELETSKTGLTEYRVVEHVVTTTTEVLKNFPIVKTE